MSRPGQPSRFKLVVRDKDGPDGTCALSPDSIDLALKADPSCKLLVERPVGFEEAMMPHLRVRVAHVAGNYTDEGSCEVRVCCCLGVHLHLSCLCRCERWRCMPGQQHTLSSSWGRAWRMLLPVRTASARPWWHCLPFDKHAKLCES